MEIEYIIIDFMVTVILPCLALYYLSKISSKDERRFAHSALGISIISFLFMIYLSILNQINSRIEVIGILFYVLFGLFVFCVELYCIKLFFRQGSRKYILSILVIISWALFNVILFFLPTFNIGAII